MAVAVVALAMLLAACLPVGTRPVIKLGLAAPFTGSDAAVGYSVVGVVREAIRQRNLAGGVSGYSVELVALDDSNLPEVAAQRAREMIIDPALMAVLGGFDGAAAGAAASEFERAGMPFVTFAAPADAGRGVWRLTASDAAAGQAGAAYAVGAAGARRIAVVSEAAPGSDPLGDAFAAAAHDGGATLSRITVRRWQLDFSAEARQLAVLSPDLVFVAGRVDEAGEMLRQMRAAGVQATVLGGPATDDARLLQIAGPAAAGVVFVSTGLPLAEVSDEPVRTLLAASSLRAPGAHTALAYDGTQVLLDALAAAITAGGKPSRAGVAAALPGLRRQGVTGDLSFDERGQRRDALIAIYRIGSSYPGSQLP